MQLTCNSTFKTPKVATNMYNWITLLSTWNYHNIVNWLCMLSRSVMSDSVTPCTAALQAPLSMGFPRQEYWSGLPFSSLGDLSDPRIEPASHALAGRFFTAEPPGKTEAIFMEDLLCASSILSPFNINSILTAVPLEGYYSWDFCFQRGRPRHWEMMWPRLPNWWVTGYS